MHVLCPPAPPLRPSAARLQSAARPSVSVSLSQNVAGPSITVSPTIAPSISPNIVSSNAQTGEGNVTPAVGAGGDAGGANAQALGAGATAQATALPLLPGALPPGLMLVPGPQVRLALWWAHAPWGPGCADANARRLLCKAHPSTILHPLLQFALQGGYILVPALPPPAGGSGSLPTVGSDGSVPSTRGSSGGSGDYAALSQAMLAQQQQQWQQQFGSSGGQPLFFPPGAPSVLSMPPGSGPLQAYTLPPGAPPPTLPPVFYPAAEVGAAPGPPASFAPTYSGDAGAPPTPHLPPDGYVALQQVPAAPMV